MDENNNLGNPNLNNGNIDNSNLNEGNQGDNLQNNPYIQNTQDNPYYNPYFQNTTIDNSLYFDNSNVALNNDIYSQSYMDAGNPQNISQMDNESNMQNTENNGNNTENNQANIENTVELSNTNNPPPDSGESLNLFELDNTANEENKTENTDSNNTMDMPSSNTQNDTNFENTSNLHINPILSQNINQIQDFNNNYSNNPSQNFVNNQFENNSQNSNNNFESEASNSYGSNNDEEFKRTWMGSLFDKANKRKFSIPSFFFGGIYYLYRKLYLFGFIFILISCIIPIIGLTMISSNITNPSGIILSSILTTILPIIVNIIYGFAFYPLYKNSINQKLNKYKNEVQSPTQLIDLAKQKGGTSILFVILGILLSSVITTIALSTILISSLKPIINGLFNDNSMQNTLNNNINNIENQTNTYDIYNFYNNYSFEYDSSKWTEDENKKLIYDNYALSYIQSIENITSAGFDINQSEGRSSFFTYLYNMFSSQIDATTTTLELGSSSFVYDNGIYYSYFDLVYQTSIERCYFVLIPEDDIFIEFILSNNDTVISDTINEEVIGYICSITTVNYQDNLDTNNITSTVVNEVGGNVSNPTSSNIVDINDAEPQSSMSNSSGNSSSNVTSSNNGMTITSNTDTNGISVMYNTMQ